MSKLKYLVFIFVFTLLLSSCSNLSSLIGCPNSEIEWVDILMIDDIQYEHHFPESALENIPIMIEKGKELGKVTYKMADRACSNHKMKNGDAAYVEEGTVIYEIKEYPTALIVAANDNVYIASTNKKAKTAGELYPMDKLVKNIYIESTEDGKIIHTFSQSSKDKFLASFYKLKLVDSQSINDEGKFKGTRIFLRFELNNSVSFRQLYWAESNVFHNGAIGNEEIIEVMNDEISKLKN